MGKCPCSASSPLRHLLLCSQVQLVLILWQLHLLVTICCNLCTQPLCTLLKKRMKILCGRAERSGVKPQAHHGLWFGILPLNNMQSGSYRSKVHQGIWKLALADQRWGSEKQPPSFRDCCVVALGVLDCTPVKVDGEPFMVSLLDAVKNVLFLFSDRSTPFFFLHLPSPPSPPPT